jgi:hypothetical protein
MLVVFWEIVVEIQTLSVCEHFNNTVRYYIYLFMEYINLSQLIKFSPKKYWVNIFIRCYWYYSWIGTRHFVNIPDKNLSFDFTNRDQRVTLVIFNYIKVFDEVIKQFRFNHYSINWNGIILLLGVNNLITKYVFRFVRTIRTFITTTLT